MKIIMASGGTGGHIYPAIAIADEFKKRYEDVDILFVGGERGLEKKLVPENGYPIKLIDVQGFDRKHLTKNIDVAKKLISARKTAKKIIEEFDPDIVIGTGGYASAPVVKAAERQGIPTYIHEQNAFPGVTNKIFEKKAKAVFLGFEEASKYFKYPEKHIYTGNPVREAFYNIDKKNARVELNMNNDDFIILAFGGSQGAGRINKAMLEVIKKFNGDKNVKIFLATGKFYYDAILDELKDIDLGDNIFIKEYISNMDKYLVASDLVISRSGAITVAESMVCAKPSIFIPSPLATGNHQFFNANAAAQMGGAIVREEKDLESSNLIEEIINLRGNPQRLEEMSRISDKRNQKRATEIICDSIKI